jgi:hypothetical protein
VLIEDSVYEQVATRIATQAAKMIVGDPWIRGPAWPDRLQDPVPEGQQLFDAGYAGLMVLAGGALDRAGYLAATVRQCRYSRRVAQEEIFARSCR